MNAISPLSMICSILRKRTTSGACLILLEMLRLRMCKRYLITIYSMQAPFVMQLFNLEKIMHPVSCSGVSLVCILITPLFNLLTSNVQIDGINYMKQAEEIGRSLI